MKNFDQQIRDRVQCETVRLTPEAEERFQEAMDKAAIARAQQPSAKPAWKKRRMVWLVSAECILAALLVFALMPARDVTDQGLAPQETQAAISAGMIPVTGRQAPEVRFTVAEENSLTLTARLRNDTEEIWLVAWEAQLSDGQHPAQQLVWLEPGTECSARAWWQADAGAVLQTEYCGYRVTAGVLHWMDGEWLQPGAQGYAEQQETIEAAMEAGALILAPGMWINGQAGPMRLVLPDQWQQEHPEQTALAYYVENGMIEEESGLCSGSERFAAGE